jgi:hypothetical protein
MPTDIQEQSPANLQVQRWGGTKRLTLRICSTAAALAVWFWTQSLIASRGLPASGIGDWTHTISSSANRYLHAHFAGANALLILSSAVIDLMAIFLLARWLFQNESRPFVSLILVLGLRQLMQFCVALPAPPNQIWHSPGFPSLLVTYNVANDYFFSGHTAIAVLAAVELSRMNKIWTTWLGVVLVIFEIATVLILRAHYAMDVFTGLITGLYVPHLADWLQTAWERKNT